MQRVEAVDRTREKPPHAVPSVPVVPICSRSPHLRCCIRVAPVPAPVLSLLLLLLSPLSLG